MINFVRASGDARRILSLPRRIWDADPMLEQLRDALNRSLKTPFGKMELWPIQAAALVEVLKEEGGFFPIGVGAGKTLISLLAPILLEANRPLLLVPAQLREQTKKYVLPEMRKSWKLPQNLKVVGYSELSLAKNAKMLEELQPDLIILDECHRVKNTKSARTKRLIRHFRNFPNTKCIAMSGTVTNRSLKDFAHILIWCLKEKAPIPLKWTELSDWANAIDEKVNPDNRVAPGILKKLCQKNENVRQGYRRRLIESPGVISSKETSLGTSLVVKGLYLDYPDNIKKLLSNLRASWETPNKDPILHAVDLWRHARELALGFWYRWHPKPPQEWLDARRNWKLYVAETLKHNKRKLDTELQVWNECKKSPIPEWEEWKYFKDVYKPTVIAEWESDFAIRACIAWLRSCKQEAPGILWVEHRAFGERLAKESRFPYYGAGDSRILADKGNAIIASISAHGEGKNLQHFSKNLVVSPPSSGKIWEQLLGRTHRSGQISDEVLCEIFLDNKELMASFRQALLDAKYIEDTIGNRQKLNYARVVL